MTLKTRVLAPMPAARVIRVMVVKRGERRRRRRTCLSCCRKDCIGAPEWKMAGADEGAATAGCVAQREVRRGGARSSGNLGGGEIRRRETLRRLRASGR